MDYDKLIEQILSEEILKNGLDKLVSEDDRCLNLVVPNWKDVLQNDIKFQNFSDGTIRFGTERAKSYYAIQHLTSADQYRIIVAGQFSMSENNQLTSVFCPPLNEIGKIIFSDRPDIKVWENFRFFIRSCSAYTCRLCREAQKEFSYQESLVEWCINKTRVFNGMEINSMFRNTAMNNFKGGNFFAILSLTIDCRFTSPDEGDAAKNIGKIGGKCECMILFKETSLGSKAPLNLERVVPPITHGKKKRSGDNDDVRIISTVDESIEVGTDYEDELHVDCIPAKLTKREREEDENVTEYDVVFKHVKFDA